MFPVDLSIYIKDQNERAFLLEWIESLKERKDHAIKVVCFVDSDDSTSTRGTGKTEVKLYIGAYTRGMKGFFVTLDEKSRHFSNCRDRYLNAHVLIIERCEGALPQINEPFKVIHFGAFNPDFEKFRLDGPEYQEAMNEIENNLLIQSNVK